MIGFSLSIKNRQDIFEENTDKTRMKRQKQQKWRTIDGGRKKSQ